MTKIYCSGLVRDLLAWLCPVYLRIYGITLGLMLESSLVLTPNNESMCSWRDVDGFSLNKVFRSHSTQTDGAISAQRHSLPL